MASVTCCRQHRFGGREEAEEGARETETFRVYLADAAGQTEFAKDNNPTKIPNEKKETQKQNNIFWKKKKTQGRTAAPPQGGRGRQHHTKGEGEVLFQIISIIFGVIIIKIIFRIIICVWTSVCVVGCVGFVCGCVCVCVCVRVCGCGNSYENCIFFRFTIKNQVHN